VDRRTFCLVFLLGAEFAGHGATAQPSDHGGILGGPHVLQLRQPALEVRPVDGTHYIRGSHHGPEGVAAVAFGPVGLVFRTLDVFALLLPPDCNERC
jgi:hypothetical protein